MKSECSQREPVISDAELHRFVAHALGGHVGASPSVVEIQRRLCDYHSSFAIEEVTAYFEDGTARPLIFKNLSTECLLGHAREIRPALTYHPAREVVVYRDILARLKLGTAICYAAVADVAEQRYWLLLEKVFGTDLARTGSFAIWRATARWLAEAHGRLTTTVQQQGTGQELMRYDDCCFHQWVDQAERALQRPQVADGRAVAPLEIEWLLKRCRTAIRLVSTSMPTEVIHGEFYPSNVLIDGQDTPPRICPIDWETAGIGPRLIDLAALVSGSWTEPQKVELASVYFAAYADEDATAAHLLDQMTALRCCRLLLAMKWIGWSIRWQPPPEHSYDWLAEALDLARMLSADLKQI